MRKRKLFFSIIILLVISLGIPLAGFHGHFACIAQAESTQQADDIAKEIAKELRSAEKNMFSGKNEEADKQLEEISAKLIVLKKLDPEHKKIKTLESKYKRTKKTIDKKLGRTTKVSSGEIRGLAEKREVKQSSGEIRGLAEKREVKQSSGEIRGLAEKRDVKQSSGEIRGLAKRSEVNPIATTNNTSHQGISKSAQKHPHATREALKKAERAVASAETSVKNLHNPRWKNRDKSPLFKSLNRSLKTAQASLVEAKDIAASEDVANPPELRELEERFSRAQANAGGETAIHEGNQRQAEASANEITTDVNLLQVEWESFRGFFDRYCTGVINFNNMEDAKQVINAIEQFEQNDLAGLKKKVASFADKYGTSGEEIRVKAKSMGYPSSELSADYYYLEIVKAFNGLEQSKTATAEALAGKSTEMITSKFGHDFSLIERYEEAKVWLDLAAKLEPSNKLVIQELSTIDKRVAQGMKAFDKKINAQKWQGHANNAPKDAKKLAGISKDYFENSPEWGKRDKKPYKILAVTVSGPWSVQKKDLFGSPIMYGLPVFVALQLKEDKKNNLARVFILTLRTFEQSNPKMEPPFQIATVGDSYYIRPSAIK